MRSMITLMFSPLLSPVQAFHSFSPMTPRMKLSVAKSMKPATTMRFCSHIQFTAICEVELVIKRTMKVKPRESKYFQRAFVARKVRMSTTGSSSHQSLYANLLVVHSRLSTLISGANLLYPLTFVNRVKFSVACAFIALSDGDISDSNTTVACILGNEE